ncbi:MULTISPECIES: tRNA (adenosine(37)-N6)-threonylcarbamoyltransferase complex ATPase subunit type 1 TsaE [unclassified Mucilaginibacter]|uniref:tRNA (adenosine(37)-N6)-threonylcarbamoyltransferase complex ATPase subunit type 1 TsaE n=1 Tax=unclassified Mucilaginibacter TaxID=2617802 RepID=UPI002AC9D901|nr:MULTISPECIES: tRNA (adenosine(37)-N6)-threonylcarbamoyltransferase complex ATPase subunit type 1 TsaE [unclassified Mucilaginibacter]MEB0261715.1 tRNA (adenosine(37)-N6)-threonylcarbamoyltransferase complex ATPase subunit type 1 TsaE [Mucilaginibacter sp. 10I4]MEB0278365.1 tRNA (adenosine(37)-N6)-threonylcarbamoyltransferase complex ATPase subunit type 1 TsaE [Mucilaginibacter sp. 10B2]MEB0301014.1 tRNA (adenosine(37)-N6)-threonylcarbamoyltransferase complex ATPase subunit type 1 TsaE [Mucila
MDLHITSTAELPQVASGILNFAGDTRIFLFYGDMGAGKTTLIKALCSQLGVLDAATSPTFSIVNQYEGQDGPVYHFDFYRLKDQNEALDMGYEEYFYSGNYCFIEWPEKIANLIPDSYTGVRIHVIDATSRQISVENIS